MLKRILIVDDHLLFADGLKLIFQQVGGVDVDVATNVQNLLKDDANLGQYELIVMDLHMPEMDGFSFLQAVRARQIRTKVLVISGTENQSEIEQVIALGAQGYIPKDSTTEQLLISVKTVLDGARYLPEKWEGQVNWLQNEQPDLPESKGKIGPRQLEVLKLMRDGLRNKQIALVLGISESAVKSHVEILFQELRVPNRTSCVLLGIQKGLIEERPQGGLLSSS